jgi:hypothetical protein
MNRTDSQQSDKEMSPGHENLQMLLEQEANQTEEES